VQILVMAAAAGVLAFTSNAMRSGLPWRGSAAEEIVHRDVDWIDATDAAALLHDVSALFLDARPAAAFENRRVQGAVSFPADALDAAYADLRDFLDASMTVIVYADDANLTVRAARFLKERGLNVRCVAGGWEAWQDARLPTEGGAP
jgi:rhodanese-related sulfurtransferase